MIEIIPIFLGELLIAKFDSCKQPQKHVRLLCCGSIHANCSVHCETISLQPAHFVFTLGWKRLCQNIKTILFTKLTYLLSEDESLHFSWFCISGIFFFLSRIIEFLKLFFFKVIYPWLPMSLPWQWLPWRNNRVVNVVPSEWVVFHPGCFHFFSRILGT